MKAMGSFQNRLTSPAPSNSKVSPTSATAYNPPPPPPQPVHSNAGIGTCTAQYDYTSNEAGDLPFAEGDRVTILAKESADWWRGQIHGRTGLFPASKYNIANNLVTRLRAEFICSLVIRLCSRRLNFDLTQYLLYVSRNVLY